MAGYELLLSIIEDVGYSALFLVLCLGLIGLPIPNEAVVMTGGALASSGVLAPIPSFLMTFLGICSAMTFGYSIGRFAGSKLSAWFSSKKNIEQFLTKSEQLSKRFGGFAISLSLCLPFLRHVTPYVMGLNKMPFKRFALFAYPSALVWTFIYFFIGTLVGDKVPYISSLINQSGIWIVSALTVAVVAYLIFKSIRSRNTKENVEDVEQQM